MPTRTHTGRHTHRRVEHHSREMAPIHFVRRNRTNFGSEPELMSRSLMCKSSSPTAKPIQSTHNPAQVQLCSLLHYLSCVPNSVRPPTANKTCIWRGINTRPYATTLKKKKKKEENTDTAAAPGWWGLCRVLCPRSVYPLPGAIFSPPMEIRHQR